MSESENRTNPAASVLDKLKGNDATTEEVKQQEMPEVIAESTGLDVKVGENVKDAIGEGDFPYQEYNCARGATNIITPTGRRIKFAMGKFITKDLELCEYLDAEIKNGMPGITKGERVATDSVDPNEVLKNEHFTQFLEAAQSGAFKDFGIYGAGNKGGNITTSGQVAN